MRFPARVHAFCVGSAATHVCIYRLLLPFAFAFWFAGFTPQFLQFITAHYRSFTRLRCTVWLPRGSGSTTGLVTPRLRFAHLLPLVHTRFVAARYRFFSRLRFAFTQRVAAGSAATTFTHALYLHTHGYRLHALRYRTGSAVTAHCRIHYPFKFALFVCAVCALLRSTWWFAAPFAVAVRLVTRTYSYWLRVADFTFYTPQFQNFATVTLVTVRCARLRVLHAVTLLLHTFPPARGSAVHYRCVEHTAFGSG